MNFWVARFATVFIFASLQEKAIRIDARLPKPANMQLAEVL